MTAEQPTGELSLRIERRRDANGGDGTSVATSQFHRGALRVLRRTTPTTLGRPPTPSLTLVEPISVVTPTS